MKYRKTYGRRVLPAFLLAGILVLAGWLGPLGARLSLGQQNLPGSLSIDNISPSPITTGLLSLSGTGTGGSTSPESNATCTGFKNPGAIEVITAATELTVPTTWKIDAGTLSGNYTLTQTKAGNSVSSCTNKQLKNFLYSFSISNLNVSSLSAGTHTIFVTAVDGFTGGTVTASAPFTIQQPAKPTISLSPSSFTFNGTSGSATPASQTLNISNTGTGALNFTAKTDQAWCRVNNQNNSSSITGTVPAGGSQAVSVSVDAPSNVGSFACVISVSDPNASNSPQTASVTYTVTAGGGQTYTLTVNKSVQGNGTITSADGKINCGTTCSTQTATYTAGSSVTLTALPDLNSDFSGWTGAYPAPPTQTSVSFFINANLIQTANFTITIGPGASLTANPTSVNYNGSSTLSWNCTNSDSASLSSTPAATPSGAVALSGSQATSALSQPITYTLTCTKPGFQPATASTTIGINTGAINVAATLNGNPWTGLVNYSVSGPAPASDPQGSFSATSVANPSPFSPKYSGLWVFTYLSGGPAGASLSSITSASSQTLPAAGSITFTMNFVSAPAQTFAYTVSPTSLNFSSVQFVTPPSQSITVTNTGNQSLTVSVGNDSSWAVPGANSVTVAPGAQALVQVIITNSGLPPGTYTGHIDFTHVQAGNQSTTVTYTITPPPKPAISLSPASFTFSGVSGGPTPAAQTLTISNTGGSALNYTAKTNQTWCRLNNQNNTGQITGTVPAGGSQSPSVSVDAPSNAGSFACVISVSDPNATNSPQTASVTYNVRPPSFTLNPPASPAGSTAPYCSGTTSQVSLSWTVSAGATRYDVYRNGSQIQLNAASPYTDSPLTPGTAYTYFIRASNSAGFTDSNPQSFTARFCAGDITVKATLDGNPWNGSLNYRLIGPGPTVQGNSVAETKANLQSGLWDADYLNGGPAGTGAPAITPAASQTLASGLTAKPSLTFILTFTTPAPGPSVNLSASPNPVDYNTASTLSWSSSNATACTAGGAWSGSKALSGSQSTGNLTGAQTYTLTCTGPGGSDQKSLTVNVNPQGAGGTPADFALSVTPLQNTVQAGQSASYTVTATNCSGSFDGKVINLQLLNPPPNTSVRFVPNNKLNKCAPADSATLTLSTDASGTPPGAYNFTVQGTAQNFPLTKTAASSISVQAPASSNSNLSASDIDITRVNGSGVNASACSAATEALGSQSLLQAGDIISLKLNICNSGDKDAKIRQVQVSLTNLSQPPAGFSASFNGSAITPQVGQSGGKTTLTFDLNNATVSLGGGVANLTFSAKLVAPSGASSGLYRFQSSGVITENNNSATLVSTPLLLFQFGVGTPQQLEIAP